MRGTASTWRPDSGTITSRKGSGIVAGERDREEGVDDLFGAARLLVLFDGR